MTSCPTYFGRMNDVSEPYDMLQYVRDISTPLVDCTCHETDNPADAHDKKELMPTGIFRDEERADYATLYRQKIASVAAKRSAK